MQSTVFVNPTIKKTNTVEGKHLKITNTANF